MANFGKHTEQFVISDFPGYFSGPSMTKLPPGAVIDSGLVTELTKVRVDDSGELITFADQYQLAKFTDSTNAHDAVVASEYSNCIYWWHPQTGGDRILISYAESWRELYFPSTDSRPTLAPIYRLPGVWKMHTNGFHQYGMFEPFGDDLYYVDGINPMVRISVDVSNRLEAAWAGVFDRYEDINSLWHTKWKPYRGMGDQFSNAGITRYCITFSSKHGESKSGYNAVRNAFQVNDPATWGKLIWGPSGSARTIIIDWNRVLTKNPYITHANVYRTAVGSDVFQWAGKIPRYQTSMVDARNDAQLGYPMETDNEVPSNFRLICSYENRLFAVGGYEQYNRISCSKLGRPEIWPPQYVLPTNDAYSQDNITLLKKIGPHLYVFMENHILRLVGSAPENYSFEVVSNSIGCVAPRSFMYWNEGAVFLTRDGLYFFNGASLSRLSQPIYSMFNDNEYGLLDLKFACGALFGNTYLLSMVDSTIGTTVTGAYPTRVYSCNLINGKWGVKTSGAFYLSAQMGRDRSLIYVHDTDGQGIKVAGEWYLEDGDRDSVVFNIGNLDLGYPDQVKTIEKIELVYEAIGEVTTVVTVYLENNPANVGTIWEQSTDTFTADNSYMSWGDNWSLGGTLGFMQVHRSVHYFGKTTKQCASKSFLIQVNLGQRSPEIRLQKLIIDFHVDSSVWRGETVA